MVKIHKFVSCDPDLCTGCTVCEYACSLEKDGVFNPIRSRIRALRVYPSGNLAIACRMCEDAPCVIACPRDALQQSEEDGHIIVDEDKCNGCGWCVEACDFGAITVGPDKIAIVCDLCDGEPKCIDVCPVEALSLQSRETKARKSRISATAARILADAASEADK
ncbi:MAG: 4Fe-4S dicluster domain-containing protein [Candidatus Thorarchaeota archaeon]|nr:4Fe-4S dicluster domain-containing protein [Candidatus Thorarchaeota archaeon]